MSGVDAERDAEPGGRLRAPGQLATLQAFLNTANIEAGTDVFDRPDGAAQWLNDHDLMPESTVKVDDAGLNEVIGFREALRDVLSARHDGHDVPARARAQIAAISAGALGVTVHPDGQLIPTVDAVGLDAALARLVLIALEAASSGQWDRLKVCPNDACRWAFWDSSRNRSGRWCTMSLCGNQTKVRNYRRRNRT